MFLIRKWINKKHDWFCYENRHPFLTGWECRNCGKQILIQNHDYPDEVAEGKTNCRRDDYGKVEE